MDIIIVEEVEVALDDPQKSFVEHRMIYSGSEPFIIQKHKNYVQLSLGGLTTRYYGALVIKSNIGVELYRYESESSVKPQQISIKETHHYNDVTFFHVDETLIMSVLMREGREIVVKRFIVADAGLSLSFAVQASDNVVEIVKAFPDIVNTRFGAPQNRLFLDMPKYREHIDVSDYHCFEFSDLLKAKRLYGIEFQSAQIKTIQIYRKTGENYGTLDADYIHEFKGRFIELDDASDFLQNRE